MQLHATDIRVHDVSLLAQHEAHGTVQADCRQRLIGDVQQQHPAHVHLPLVTGPFLTVSAGRGRAAGGTRDQCDCRPPG